MLRPTRFCCLEILLFKIYLATEPQSNELALLCTLGSGLSGLPLFFYCTPEGRVLKNTRNVQTYFLDYKNKLVTTRIIKEIVLPVKSA